MSIVDKINNLILIYNQQINLESLRVITDLKWLLSYIEENPVVIEEEKKPKQVKEAKVNKYTPEEIDALESIKELNETPIEKDIKELRAEYKEKFNKNPFGWWSKEILESKLK